MKMMKEDKGHPKYVSDDLKAYACVPTGRHYVAFDPTPEYGVSIPFARENYDPGSKLKTAQKGK